LSGTVRVDGRQPVHELLYLAVDRGEVEVLEGASDLAHLALTDGPAVDLRHRSDLDAGAAQEDLVGDVELGAVDAPLHDRHPELRRELEDGTPRDADQDVVGDGGCDELAAHHQEDVGGAALGDVPVAGEQDGLVEACLLGVGDGQRRVDVSPGRLGPGGDSVVVVAAPARNRHDQPAGDVEVRAHRGAEATEAVLEMEETDLDHRRGFVGDRTNVHVLPIAGSPNDLNRDVAQLL